MRSLGMTSGIAFLSLFCWTGYASAYCLSTLCPGATENDCHVCVPSQPDDSWTTTRWPQACIGFSVQESASNQVSSDEFNARADAAFNSWMNADCGGGSHPSIRITNLGPVQCSGVEYNQRGAGNSNIISFRDDVWPVRAGRPPDDSTRTIGLTTVTKKDDERANELPSGIVLHQGDILNADMELNSANFHFTTSDTAVQTDLLAILTHETGHFLGLAHSEDEDATMYKSYSAGSTAARDLSPDDVAAICALYPPDRPLAGECNPLPFHGFSTECKTEQVTCGVAAAGSSRGGWETPPLLGLAGLAGLLRRFLTLSTRSTRNRRRSRRTEFEV